MSSKCIYEHYTLDMNIFPVSSSVIEATATLGTSNENRTLYSIIVTCTINPDSTADMCEVMATANDQTRRGNEYICMYICTYGTAQRQCCFIRSSLTRVPLALASSLQALESTVTLH